MPTVYFKLFIFDLWLSAHLAGSRDICEEIGTLCQTNPHLVWIHIWVDRMDSECGHNSMDEKRIQKLILTTCPAMWGKLRLCLKKGLLDIYQGDAEIGLFHSIHLAPILIGLRGVIRLFKAAKTHSKDKCFFMEYLISVIICAQSLSLSEMQQTIR